jgi:hypothetical protein
MMTQSDSLHLAMAGMVLEYVVALEHIILVSWNGHRFDYVRWLSLCHT